MKILATSILIALPGIAIAQTDITPSISIKESLVHEKDDSSSNSGQITTIAPGISVVSSGPRSELQLDYTLLANYSSGGLDQDDGENHLLEFLSSYQHSPGKWISSLRASSELTNVDVNGRQNTNPDFDDGNTEELHTIAIDTTVTDRWTDTIQYRASLGADYTSLDGDDSRGATFLAELDNLRSPDDFTWRIQADRLIANEDNGDETIDTYNAYLNYRLNRIWSTFYDYIHYELDFGDSDFDDEDPDDAWLLGVIWQPNTRTSVSVGAGRRGSDDKYSLDAVHTRQNLSFSASYSEDITTARQDTLNQQQSDFLAQSTFDSISAEPILQKRADLNFSIFGQYSTLSTSVFQTDRSRRSNTQDEITTGGEISYLRKMTVRDNLSISLLGQEIKDVEDNDLTELTISYLRTHSKTETIIISMGWSDENSTRSEDDYERTLVSGEYRVTF